MRRLFKVIFQLLGTVVAIFILTAVWIVFDGLTDQGEKADVALVTGHADPDQIASERPQLDRAIKLYHDGDFPFIIVSGPGPGLDEAPAGMAGYLQKHGIPASVIIRCYPGEGAREMARRVAAIMKARQFDSVMVVSDYYHITRTKLALSHENVEDIQKAHVGKLREGDAWRIGREVVALYAYVGDVYLFPTAKKVQEEAKVGMKQASADAEKAKEKVDKGLENLSK